MDGGAEAVAVAATPSDVAVSGGGTNPHLQRMLGLDDEDDGSTNNNTSVAVSRRLSFDSPSLLSSPGSSAARSPRELLLFSARPSTGKGAGATSPSPTIAPVRDTDDGGGIVVFDDDLQRPAPASAPEGGGAASPRSMDQEVHHESAGAPLALRPRNPNVAAAVAAGGKDAPKPSRGAMRQARPIAATTAADAEGVITDVTAPTGHSTDGDPTASSSSSPSSLLTAAAEARASNTGVANGDAGAAVVVRSAGPAAVSTEEDEGVAEARMWKNLKTLKALLDNGFVDAAEYDRRKAQLIDGLTGTSTAQQEEREKQRRQQQQQQEEEEQQQQQQQQQQLTSSWEHAAAVANAPAATSGEAPQQRGAAARTQVPPPQPRQRTGTGDAHDHHDLAPLGGAGPRRQPSRSVAARGAGFDPRGVLGCSNSDINNNNNGARQRALSTAGRGLFGRRAGVGAGSHAPSEEDMARFAVQPAMKFVFNLESRKWQSSHIRVRMDPVPFAVGGLRRVHHMQELPGSAQAAAVAGAPTAGAAPAFTPLVGKIAKKADEEPAETYFRDVEMQVFCRHYAHLFNARDPPKRIQFAPAWVIKVPDKQRGKARFYGVEPFLEGQYSKYNNNCGFVGAADRNTPQAFSHFTYEASGRKLIIVDIQGVGDRYTDPQIHTVGNAFPEAPAASVSGSLGAGGGGSNASAGGGGGGGVGAAASGSDAAGAARGGRVRQGAAVGGGIDADGTNGSSHSQAGRATFGKGNLGNIGIIKFFSTHRCNGICRLLKLPPMNPKNSSSGTQVAGYHHHHHHAQQQQPGGIIGNEDPSQHDDPALLDGPLAGDGPMRWSDSSDGERRLHHEQQQQQQQLYRQHLQYQHRLRQGQPRYRQQQVRGRGGSAAYPAAEHRRRQLFRASDDFAATGPRAYALSMHPTGSVGSGGPYRGRDDARIDGGGGGGGSRRSLSASNSSSRMVVGLETSASVAQGDFPLPDEFSEESSMSVASSDVHSVEAWDAPPRSALHKQRQVALMASVAPTPAAAASARGPAGANGCGCAVM